MRSLTVIVLFSASFLACSRSRSSNRIDYIKVLKEGSSATVTDYNRGIGLDQYLFYSFDKDSVVYRSFVNEMPSISKTFVGSFGNSFYRDTLLMLVDVLENGRNGLYVADSGMYIDPDPATFHLEYRDRFGVHRRTFVTIDNDTLSRFAWFLVRLPSMSWPKQLSNDSLFNSEAEIIEAAKANGTYYR